MEEEKILEANNQIKEASSQITLTTKKKALAKFGLAALGSTALFGGFISTAARLKT